MGAHANAKIRAMHLPPGSVWLTVLLGLLGALYDGSARPMTTALALAGLGALCAERFLMRRPGVA